MTETVKLLASPALPQKERELASDILSLLEGKSYGQQLRALITVLHSVAMVSEKLDRLFALMTLLLLTNKWGVK